MGLLRNWWQSYLIIIICYIVSYVWAAAEYKEKNRCGCGTVIYWEAVAIASGCVILANHCRQCGTRFIVARWFAHLRHQLWHALLRFTSQICWVKMIFKDFVTNQQTHPHLEVLRACVCLAWKNAERIPKRAESLPERKKAQRRGE